MIDVHIWPMVHQKCGRGVGRNQWRGANNKLQGKGGTKLFAGGRARPREPSSAAASAAASGVGGG